MHRKISGYMSVHRSCKVGNRFEAQPVISQTSPKSFFFASGYGKVY